MSVGRNATSEMIEELPVKPVRYDVKLDGDLLVSVLPNGVKTWAFLYAQRGRTRRKTLGVFPEMSEAQARRALDDARRTLQRVDEPLDQDELLAQRQAPPVASARASTAAAAGGGIWRLVALLLVAASLIGGGLYARHRLGTGDGGTATGRASDPAQRGAPRPAPAVLPAAGPAAGPSDRAMARSPVLPAADVAESGEAPDAAPGPGRALPRNDSTAAQPEVAEPLDSMVSVPHADTQSSAGQTPTVSRDPGDGIDATGPASAAPGHLGGAQEPAPAAVVLPPTAAVNPPDSAPGDPAAAAPDPAASTLPGRGDTATPAEAVANDQPATAGTPGRDQLAGNRPAPTTPSAPVETAPSAASAPAFVGEVARAWVTRGVEDLEPVDRIGERLEPGDSGFITLYYYNELRETRPGRILHRWEYDGEVVAEVTLKVGGGWRWRTYSSKDLLPEMTGMWRVSLVAEDGTVLAQQNFEYR